MEHLNPSDIESVTVLKDKKAMELYGEKGKFGVIKNNGYTDTPYDLLSPI